MPTDKVDVIYSPLQISRQDWGIIGLAFLVSRIMLYAIGYFGAMHYNVETDQIGRINLLESVETDVWNVFCQFDCTWFKSIADIGYDTYPHGLTTGHAANWAFFPMFPMLGHYIGELFGISSLHGFYVVANISSFAMLPLFFLCLRQLGQELDVARFGVWMLAFSPYSVYFIAPYTEALFITLTMVVFLFAYRHQWFWVGLAGMLMTATRNIGVIVVFSVAILALQAYGWRELVKLGDRAFRVILAIWFIPLVMFMYMFYMHYHVGDAFSFKNIQLAWGRIAGNPFYYWIEGFEAGGRKLYLAIMVAIGWSLNIYLVKQKRYAEALFMFICTFVPITTSINTIPRYMFGLYPTTLAIVLIARDRPNLRPIMLAVSALLSSYFVIAWVNAKFFTV